MTTTATCGSPCIDAGTNARRTPHAYDLDGDARNGWNGDGMVIVDYEAGVGVEVHPDVIFVDLNAVGAGTGISWELTTDAICRPPSPGPSAGGTIWMAEGDLRALQGARRDRAGCTRLCATFQLKNGVALFWGIRPDRGRRTPGGTRWVRQPHHAERRDRGRRRVADNSYQSFIIRLGVWPWTAAPSWTASRVRDGNALHSPTDIGGGMYNDPPRRR